MKYLDFSRAVAAYNKPYHLRTTVVIPHYNTHTLLARCIASLAAQSYPKELVNVIISDDGSDYVPVAEDLAKDKSLNLEIITGEHQGFGASSARNRAIEKASGEVILCLDADMIPVERFVEEHLRCFHVSEKVATIGPRKFIDVGQIAAEDVITAREHFNVYPDVRSVSNHYYPFDGRIPFLEKIEHEPRPYWFFYSCNVGFSRRLAIEIGLFDQGFDGHWGYEDIEFGYRLFRTGCQFIYVPFALAFHQENTVTSSSKRDDDGNINFNKLLTKWPELEDEEPETIPNTDRLDA